MNNEETLFDKDTMGNCTQTGEVYQQVDPFAQALLEQLSAQLQLRVGPTDAMLKTKLEEFLGNAEKFLALFERPL